MKILTKRCLKTDSTVNHALPGQVADGSSRVINTLVALKSSQIAVASTTQGLDPQRIDLSSVETSVSWFYKFSAAVTTASQAEAPLTIL